MAICDAHTAGSVLHMWVLPCDCCRCCAGGQGGGACGVHLAAEGCSSLRVPPHRVLQCPQHQGGDCWPTARAQHMIGWRGHWIHLGCCGLQQPGWQPPASCKRLSTQASSTGTAGSFSACHPARRTLLPILQAALVFTAACQHSFGMEAWPTAA